MRRPSHSSPFHHSNNIYRGVRNMKLRILTLKGQCNWVLLIVSCLISLFESPFIKFVSFSMWSRVYRTFARICDSCNFKHRFTLPCGFDSPLCLAGGGGRFILQCRKKTVEVSVLRQLIKKCSLPQCCVESTRFAVQVVHKLWQNIPPSILCACLCYTVSLRYETGK
jgi:hypothetical protein